MRVVLLTGLTSLLLLSACRKETVFTNIIRFSDPQVGQKSMYIHIRGEGYKEKAPYDFIYTADTLIAEVIDKDPDTPGVYTIKEYLTPGSAEMQSSIVGIRGGKSVYCYQIQVSNETVRLVAMLDALNPFILPRLFPKKNLILPLNQNINKQVKLAGWMPDEGLKVDTGYVKNFKTYHSFFKRLSFIRNYEDMGADGDGIFYLYHKDWGIVRVGALSGWGNGGHAWELLGAP